VFAAAVNVTDPFPLPVAPDVIVMKLAPLEAVHAQSELPCTVTVPDPPNAAMPNVAVLSVREQPGEGDGDGDGLGEGDGLGDGDDAETVMRSDPTTPEYAALMSAAPAVMPVTRPLDDTVAIVVFDDDHGPDY
jgi:hypothetical protein